MPRIIQPTRLLLTFSLLFLWGHSYSQQQIGFLMPEDVKSVEIPFEEFSNLIVVPVTINGFVTLKFVLDTGAESIILTEKVFGDILGLNYVRTISIDGPGIKDSIKAYVANNVYLSIGSQIKAKGMHMLVLQEDYLELSKTLGEEIYGIIGYDFFSRFVVEVNYDAHILTISDPKFFKPRKNFEQIPMKVKTTKPYIESIIEHHGHKDTLSLMMDTGASHALLLDHEVTEAIVSTDRKIEASLGQGIGGQIPGYLSRLDHYGIGKANFEEILISIPLPGVYIDALKRGSRHGTIGGELLSRLHIIIDYPHQMLFVEKGNKSNRPFEYDMSGLRLKAQGAKLDSILIVDVRDGSPAYLAGILPGDFLLRLNGLSTYNATISQMSAYLRRKDKQKIALLISRDGKKIKKYFRLKKII